jgi:hypothetical protein
MGRDGEEVSAQWPNFKSGIMNRELALLFIPDLKIEIARFGDGSGT